MCETRSRNSELRRGEREEKGVIFEVLFWAGWIWDSWMVPSVVVVVVVVIRKKIRWGRDLEGWFVCRSVVSSV